MTGSSVLCTRRSRCGVATGLLLAFACAAPGARRPRIEVSLEGSGRFHMNDGEVLTRLVRRSLERRFPGGYEHVLVTLNTRRGDSRAGLSISVSRPAGLDGVRLLAARIRVSGYRKALDLGTTRDVEIELEKLQVVLDPSLLARTLSADGRPLEVRRIRPRQRFGLEEGEEEVRAAFSRAAQAAGYPPAGPEATGRVLNAGSTSLWLFQGTLGAPIGNPGVVCAEPRIVPGGRLALRLTMLFAAGRRRESREVLALEAMVQDELRRFWTELERRLDGRGFLTAGSIGSEGELLLEGVGYLSFHFESGVLAEEERRSRWRANLLVNPAR